MDLKRDIPREAAHQFVAHSEDFLSQALGRPFDLKELSEFIEVVGASILGSMYAVLRAHVGKDKSEIWLKKAMVVLSSTVRLRGADALVKVDVAIKDMPNRLSKREELHAPQVPAPAAEAPVCVCGVVADGSCPSCIVEISETMGNAFKSMIEMVRIGKKTEALCTVCKVNHGDRAIASIVPEVVKTMDVLGPGKEGSTEDLANLVLQLGMSLGVEEMPLTQAALKENLAKEEEDKKA